MKKDIKKNKTETRGRKKKVVPETNGAPVVVLTEKRPRGRPRTADQHIIEVDVGVAPEGSPSTSLSALQGLLSQPMNFKTNLNDIALAAFSERSKFGGEERSDWAWCFHVANSAAMPFYRHGVLTLCMRDVLFNNYKEFMDSVDDAKSVLEHMKNGISERNWNFIEQLCKTGDNFVLRQLNHAFFYYPQAFRLKILQALPLFDPFSSPLVMPYCSYMFFGDICSREDFTAIVMMRPVGYLNSMWSFASLLRMDDNPIHLEILGLVKQAYPAIATLMTNANLPLEDTQY